MNIADQGPILLIKEGVDNGASPTALRATYLDDSGQSIWPEGLRDVATFQANKGRIHHTEMVNNQSVAVFVEQKSGSAKIYAQNIVEGEVVLSQNDFDSAIDLLFINPFSQNLLSKATNPEIYRVEIYDAYGRRIIDITNTANLASYDVSQWASGLYYLRVSDQAQNEKIYRLLKE